MSTVDIYTTKQNDTWDLISYNVYGSEFYINELMTTNPAYRFVNVFDAGTEIICPDVTLPKIPGPAWGSEEEYNPFE